MRIAAIGDSFTEGIGDEWPDGTPRGWADRVAEGLAERLDEPVYYANFAIRGLTLKPIVTGQLDAALALDPLPDMILFNGGGNDMLRPTVSVKKLISLTDKAITKAKGAGVPLTIVTGATPTDHLPLSNLFIGRGDAYVAAAREHVAETGTRMISNWEDVDIRDRRYWADDRLHLGPLGHRRVAAAVLTELGYPTALPAPGDPFPERTKESEAEFRREHVYPYVGRRLASRSTSIGVTAKYPDWTLISPVQDAS